MTDVDDWLKRAEQITRTGAHEVDIDRIQRQLATEPGAAMALRHDARLLMLAAALSALVALTGTVSIVSGTRQTPAATWIAMPPAASPFGLLVGK